MDGRENHHGAEVSFLPAKIPVCQDEKCIYAYGKHASKAELTLGTTWHWYSYDAKRVYYF